MSMKVRVTLPLVQQRIHAAAQMTPVASAMCVGPRAGDARTLGCRWPECFAAGPSREAGLHLQPPIKIVFDPSKAPIVQSFT